MSTRLFAVLRTAFFGTLFVALWTWLAPRWMAMSKHVALQPVLGWHLVPMAIGGAIMLRCCWDFAWTGRGTPMPLDPPRSTFGDDYVHYTRAVGAALDGVSRERVILRRVDGEGPVAETRRALDLRVLRRLRASG